VDFGASFGVKCLFIKTETANPSATGVIRLASADTIGWRNNANGADIALSKDTSDNLKFNATKVLLSGAVVNVDINASAAIAYSKLALTGAILNADLAGSIAYSKLVLTGSIVNGDITAGTILNTAINASAAIAHTKMAALTASKAPVLDASGFVVASSVTATELGYLSGVTSAIQTQLNATVANPLTANLALGAHKITGLANGTAATDGMAFGQLFVGFQAPVQGTTTGSTSNATTNYGDTGLTATITPTSASHRVRVTVCANGFDNTGAFTTSITIARAASNLLGATGFACNVPAGTNQNPASGSFTYIDSPASTSALVYTTQLKTSNASGTARSNSQGFTQTIILEEIV
jgi:hypothetical protein